MWKNCFFPLEKKKNEPKMSQKGTQEKEKKRALEAPLSAGFIDANPKNQ